MMSKTDSTLLIYSKEYIRVKVYVGVPGRRSSLKTVWTGTASLSIMTSGSRTLYVSGQTAWDAQRRLVGGADLEAQAKQAFENLRLVVEAAGGALADVVS